MPDTTPRTVEIAEARTRVKAVADGTRTLTEIVDVTGLAYSRVWSICNGHGYPYRVATAAGRPRRRRHNLPADMFVRRALEIYAEIPGETGELARTTLARLDGMQPLAGGE